MNAVLPVLGLAHVVHELPNSAVDAGFATTLAEHVPRPLGQALLRVEAPGRAGDAGTYLMAPWPRDTRNEQAKGCWSIGYKDTNVPPRTWRYWFEARVYIAAISAISIYSFTNTTCKVPGLCKH